MKPIVIDASMAAVWSLPDEKSELGSRLLREFEGYRHITVTLFWYEYRNILVTNQKKGRITKSDIPLLISKVQSFGIVSYDVFDHERVVTLAIQHGLTGYDAAYLALAMQENAILATNDRRLAQAAFSLGVELRTALEGVG